MPERDNPGPERSTPVSPTSNLAPAETDNTALQAAQQQVANLAERAKADPGVVFQADTLAALAILRAQDPETWARVRQALQKAGMSLRDVRAELDRRAPRPPLRLVQPDEGSTASEPAESRTVGQVLADAPTPAKPLVIPDGYYLSPTATGYRVVEEDPETGELVHEERPFAYAPIVITARARDIDEGLTALHLAYRRPHGWRELIVDRGVALHKGRILDLTSQDVPVASDNAQAVAEYLHHFEAVNYARLRRLSISSHLGWQGVNGQQGFLWGQTHLMPDGRTTVRLSLDEASVEVWPAEAIAFRGVTAGDAQLVAGYHHAGTLQGWVEAIQRVRPYPKVCLALYASFVPALLQPLRIPDFLVNWSGRTTTGKTTTLRVAASPWGNPNEHAPDSLVWSWDATKVFIERASAVISGLPLILDETKRVKHPGLIAEVMYMITQGRGRGRGNLKSLALTRHWSTVLFSSGEAPITSFSKDGGARTRRLEIQGLPFGHQDEETRRLVDRLNGYLRQHYGHAGPAYVQWLQRRPAWMWRHYRWLYHHAVQTYAAQATSPEGARLASYAAAIDLAGMLVHQALKLPWPYESPLKTLWPTLSGEADDAAGEGQALQDVMSWAYAMSGPFTAGAITTPTAARSCPSAVGPAGGNVGPTGHPSRLFL